MSQLQLRQVSSVTRGLDARYQMDSHGSNGKCTRHHQSEHPWYSLASARTVLFKGRRRTISSYAYQPTIQTVLSWRLTSCTAAYLTVSVFAGAAVLLVSMHSLTTHRTVNVEVFRRKQLEVLAMHLPCTVGASA
jgi:hypothetical protein